MINKKKLWLIIFAVFITTGLSLEYFLDSYRSNLSEQNINDNNVTSFDISILYNNQLNDELKQYMNESLSSYLENYLIKIFYNEFPKIKNKKFSINTSNEKVLNENTINFDDLINSNLNNNYSNFDKKLLVNIKFESLTNNDENSINQIEILYQYIKSSFENNFDNEFINYLETKLKKKYILKFEKLYSLSQKNYKLKKFDVYLTSFFEIDVFNSFTNKLGKNEYDKFLSKIDVYVDVNSDDKLTFYSKITEINNDNPLTLTNVRELKKIIKQVQQNSAKNTFPLVTLFFIIIIISMYLLYNVTRYK